MNQINEKSFLTILLIAFAGFFFVECTTNKEDQSDTDDIEVSDTTVEPEEIKDIVDVASSVDNFTTLVSAIKAAGLVETLKGDGPFTVFAPTNEAFGKLPEGTLENLVEPENKEKLTSILTYHVIPTKLDAKEVLNAIEKGGGVAEITTVNGDELEIMRMDGNVVLKDENGNTSTVTAADIVASNGIIHMINTVVLPK